ncbi:beta-ketoacyl synthase N-terminal-like domain-containing protein [Gillisia sp. Hel_I_29]|uniref:beta-ketoacyl synthase N-terminal-like domain-containing protein n=1 Tax=Gillisia sp. Hel_I_29 TaxID=1249975 RepID=UPI00054FDB57|nr:beta-ketoacyl synthase N-terminal-like domain-containing protein [Gillisia sp. Hel_I_29]
MKKIYLHEDAIISPLGFTTADNIQSILAKQSGLKLHPNSRFEHNSFYAGIIDDDILTKSFSKIGNSEEYTKLEKMMILAVQAVLDQNTQINLKEIQLIVSTTKGNIDVLMVDSKFPEKRVLLSELANVIQQFFHFSKKPIVISNACISGGLALAVARRFINSGKFKKAIVVGGDLVSEFVVSGFNSFQAISNEPCKPFSANRTGISLGEAAAAVLVSKEKNINEAVSLIADASANDANHISGPSRTGEGLYKSLSTALNEAEVSSSQIDYLSAHGTGTSFNDSMEAIAFTKAGLQHTPINSYKAYYGHTLGAASLLESIILKHAMLKDQLYESLNFETSEIENPINIIQKHQTKNLRYAIKTSSGFGGCNLAMVFKKEIDG